MKACRLRFEGFRYQINADGSVLGQVHPDSSEMSPVIDESVADQVRAEARRLRRNKSARERSRARHEAFTSAGMTRVRGNLGGVYYE